MFRFLLISTFVLYASGCSCYGDGITCTADCSSTFCVCNTYGYGTLMNVSQGTLCFNNSLVHESQCIPRSSTDCTCSHAGVNCIQSCSSQICMCHSTELGIRGNVANGTLCYDDYLTWSSDSRCSANSVVAVCPIDGFYCTSPCSITYYYCANGIRYPEQFVPFGTVCSSNGSAGQLLNPDECLLSNTSLVSTCPTMMTSLQCLYPCSPVFYYCRNYTAYVLQNTPVGLTCYENTFILQSQPVCYIGDEQEQQFPVTLDYSNTSIIWSVLSQYTLASALAESLESAGISVLPTDIYFSTFDRRLADSSTHWITIRSSDPTLRSVLDDALQTLPFTLASHNLPVRVSLVAEPTPSVSIGTTTRAVIWTASATAIPAPKPTMWMSAADKITIFETLVWAVLFLVILFGM